MKSWPRCLTGILVTLLFISGCATPIPPPPAAEKVTASAAQPVKAAIPQNPDLVITTTQVKQLLSGPEAANYFIVDARPANKFEGGHVPGAVSIPKVVLAENLEKLPKDKTIIFYCGGLHCKLSPQSAEFAMQNGFSKVKVWYEGMPGWIKTGNYAEIETKAVEKIVMQPSNNPFVLVDARPAVKYQRSFIPGAISLPKAEFELKKGLLPADKSIHVIFYCGGYKCELSHLSATMAVALGYKKVSVYAAGAPGWKDSGLPFWGDTASGVVARKAPSTALPEAISADEFKQLVAAMAVTIVDVRSADDYATGHIPGSINIYDEDFIFKAKESVAQLPASGRVVLHCATGGRAGGAYYAILGESDYSNKNNLQYLDATIIIAASGAFEIERAH